MKRKINKARALLARGVNLTCEPVEIDISLTRPLVALA
jgi:hypothetical protein